MKFRTTGNGKIQYWTFTVVAGGTNKQRRSGGREQNKTWASFLKVQRGHSNLRAACNIILNSVNKGVAFKTLHSVTKIYAVCKQLSVGRICLPA